MEAVVSPALIEDPYAGYDNAAAVGELFDQLRAWVTQRIANVFAQLKANLPAPRP